MILVAYWHGLRASEVVAIMPDDVKDGCLTVRRLKGSDKTIQPLMKHADPLLDERFPLESWAAKSNRNQPLFPVSRERFWQIVREHARTAALPARKQHPHALKHTIAMHSIKLAGIENTRRWLGHKSMASTGEYLKVTDEEAAEAIRKATET